MQREESPEQLIALLVHHPDELADQVRGLDAIAWRTRPLEGEWSVTEILCHLRDVEREVNIPRLHRLVEEVFPFLAPADTDVLVQTRHYQDQDGPAALTTFTTARRELCRYLTNLPADAWQRQARHALFGLTTLRELVSLVVDHDQAHLKQLTETVRSVMRNT